MASVAPSRSFHAPNAGPSPFFPLARYTSLVGVHCSLLLFTALFLPRTSFSNLLSSFLTGTYTPNSRTAPANGTFPHAGDGAPSSSADRPEHPFLVALTRDPVATLGWLCAGAALLQVWWATWLRAWADDYRLSLLGAEMQADERRRVQQERVGRTGARFGIDFVELERLAEAAACTLLAAVNFGGVAVLFGAPVTSHGLHTALLALLVALLTTFAPAYVLRSPIKLSTIVSELWPTLPPNAAKAPSSMEALTRRLTWVRLFVELAPQTPIETALVYPAVCALIGAWAGVIPLALDWDRPWQAYPLPSAYAALFAAVLGALGACLVSSVQHFAQLGRRQAAAAAAAASAPERSGASADAGRKSGAEAVEEMRRSVQAVMDGMGGGEGTSGKGKGGKKRVVKVKKQA